MLKTLLDSLSNDGKVVQVEVLQTLIDMLKCSELVESFSFYPELLILKVIYAYKSDDQKVDSSSGSGGRSPVSISTIPIRLTNFQLIQLNSTRLVIFKTSFATGALECGEVCGNDSYGSKTGTNYPFGFYHNSHGTISFKYGRDKDAAQGRRALGSRRDRTSSS